MNKSEIIKEISKKLKQKWGYNKHQINVYWEMKRNQYKELTIEILQKELENI